ncbi:hypothetical protein PHET_03848 [Paragonimus heterotremus]|uniref:ETS domain-containing protein n=1 Tax=Paragonimus heterotremus TaxID=100268 RepID=A0A8J4T2K9_9TREM|nr:hypothetical protein PHET_03848 [Paragonimus heterotremus]
MEGDEWLQDDSRWTHSHSRPGVALLWPFSDCKSEVCPTPSRSLLVDEEFISWNSNVSTSFNNVPNVEESPQRYDSPFTVSSDFETCHTEHCCDYGVSDDAEEQCIPYRKQHTSGIGQSSLVQSQIFKPSNRSLSTQLSKSSKVTTTGPNNEGFSSMLANNDIFHYDLFVKQTLQQIEESVHKNLSDGRLYQISKDLGNGYTSGPSRFHRTNGLRTALYNERSSTLGKPRGESNRRRTGRLDEPNAIKTTYKHLQARCLPSDFPKINKENQLTHQEAHDSNSITDRSTLGIVKFIHGRRRHLLQFIMKLLDENHPCVKWIDNDRRTFHISVPDDLARLWGEYKKNKRMTFTSLTRSLRMYYTSGKLERLPGRHHQYRLLCSDEEMQYDMDQS